MNKMNFFAICFCAMAMGSCVKDADVLSTKAPATGEGNTYFSFSVPNNLTTKGDGTVEDSGEHDKGKPAEYEVNKVDVYLFDSATKTLSQKVVLTNLVEDATDKEVVKYTSDKFEVDPGTYNLFAIANSTISYTQTNQEDFLANVDLTYNDTYLMNAVPAEGFLMTNRASDNLGVTINQSDSITVSVDLERTVAKVDISQSEDTFVLEDSSKTQYASIAIVDYSMVNLARNFYSFRHVADIAATTSTVPSYKLPDATDATDNFGNVSNVNGYVIDPHFFIKQPTAMGSYDYTKYNFFGRYLTKLTTTDTNLWTTMPTTAIGSSLNYCLENTLLQESQLNGYTTGIVFRASVTPTYIQTSATTSVEFKDYNSTGYIYYYDYKFYGSLAILEACIGEMANVDSTIPDDGTVVLPKSVIRLTRGRDNHYVCYYNYWIKHYDNENPYEMGVMEFGIVRNNHYKIGIQSISGLGSGDPVLEPEQPDENYQTINIVANVDAWIVRDQGGVEL